MEAPVQQLILAANCATRPYLRLNGKETGQGQMLMRTVDPNKLVDIELNLSSLLKILLIPNS